MIVFIDVDDTLLDFEKCANKSVELACAYFGVEYSQKLLDTFHPINLELWKQLERKEITKDELFKVRFAKVFQTLGIEADGEAFEHEFHKNLFNSAEKIDGAEDLLQYLHSKYPLYVASNATLEQQTNRLKNAGFLKYIDGIFTSEQIGFSKPEQEYFDACCRGVGINPCDAIMIGDSVSADINGARAYGIKTIWYNHHHEDGNSVQCDFVVDHLSEIKNIL